MAGSSRYTAVLDANVLYPALLRDVLLSLADADLYSAKWSVHIRDEWMRSLLRDRPEMGVQIAAAASHGGRYSGLPRLRLRTPDRGLEATGPR